MLEQVIALLHLLVVGDVDRDDLPSYLRRYGREVRFGHKRRRYRQLHW